MADDHHYWPKIRRNSALIVFSSLTYADLDRELILEEARFRSLIEEKEGELKKLNSLTAALDEQDSYETLVTAFAELKLKESTELKAAKENYEKAKKEAADCEAVLQELSDGKRKVLLELDVLENELLKEVKGCVEDNRLEAWLKVTKFTDIAGLRFIKKMNKVGKLNLELLFFLGKRHESPLPYKLAELSDEKIDPIKTGCLYRLKVDGVIEPLSKEDMEAVGFPITSK